MADRAGRDHAGTGSHCSHAVPCSPHQGGKGGDDEHGRAVQAAGERGLKDYVEVDDIDAVLAKVESLGGTIVMPKEMIPEVGLVAMIQETEGNGIGIWKPVRQ